MGSRRALKALSSPPRTVIEASGRAEGMFPSKVPRHTWPDSTP